MNFIVIYRLLHGGEASTNQAEKDSYDMTGFLPTPQTQGGDWVDQELLSTSLPSLCLSCINRISITSHPTAIQSPSHAHLPWLTTASAPVYH